MRFGIHQCRCERCADLTTSFIFDTRFFLYVAYDAFSNTTMQDLLMPNTITANHVFVSSPMAGIVHDVEVS